MNSEFNKHGLKCCPFCNSHDVEDDYSAVVEGWVDCQSGWIYCRGCEIVFELSSPPNLIDPKQLKAAWNRREAANEDSAYEQNYR